MTIRLHSVPDNKTVFEYLPKIVIRAGQQLFGLKSQKNEVIYNIKGVIFIGVIKIFPNYIRHSIFNNRK